MNTIFSLIILLSVLPFQSDAQLKARVDQVMHTSDVREMIISPNRKQFATSDNTGTVVMRDILTGKEFGHHDFSGEVIDIFFTKIDGQILVLTASGEEQFSLTVQIYDFINQTLVQEKVLTDNAVDPELDFNPESNLLVYTDINGKIILYDIHNMTTRNLQMDKTYSIAGFVTGNKIEILNYNGDWEEGQYYNYDYTSDQLNIVNDKTHQPSYLEFDMNNKNMFRRLGIMTLCDNQINKCVNIADSTFYYSDLRTTGVISRLDFGLINEITIEDFAFSEDGKYIAFVGGEDPIEDPQSFGQYKTEGPGFVALYSIQESKMLWKTNGLDQQTKYMTNDLDWIDNENIVTSDAYGNTIFYHVSDSLYQRSYFLPQRYETNVKVDAKFDKVTFAMLENGSRVFEINNPENIHTVFDNTVLPIEEFCHQFDVIKHGPIHFSTKNKKLNHIISNASVYDVSDNNNGNILALAIEVNQQLEVSSFIQNDLGETIGFNSNGVNVFPIEKDIKVNIDILENLESSYYILIYDISNPKNSYLFQAPYFTEIQLSKDDKYIQFETLDSDHPFYEIGQSHEGLKKSHDQFNKTILDKSSNIALSLDNSKNVTIWNTTNSHTLGAHNFHANNAASVEDIAMAIRECKIDLDNNTMYYSIGNSIIKFNYKTNTIDELEIDLQFDNFDFSPDFKYLYLNAWDYENDIFWVSLISLPTQKTIYRESISIKITDKESGENFYFPPFFHESKPLVFISNNFGELRLLDLSQEEIIGTLKFYPNGDWLVFTPDGIFDGSKKGRKTLYYVSGTDVILYDQLKDTYWESDLLNKLINTPALIQAKNLSQDIELHPNVTLNLSDNNKGTISVSLTPRNGGIGKVSLYINDKEIVEDINQNRTENFDIKLIDFKDWLYTAGTNKIGIIAYNKNGWLASQQTEIYLETQLDANKSDANTAAFQNSSRRRRRNTSIKKPGLFGLFIGTSTYANPSLNLKFADKDAQYLQNAFSKVSSKDMYDIDRVKLKMLTTQSTDINDRPSKENILKALDNIAKEALPDDIIVLFFSGHGMTIEDDFYYLTSLAGNVDIKQDKNKRNEICVSSIEIRDALKSIKSNKQIMILDACHSGAIAKMLAENKTKALSTSQQKALESLKDKTGVFVLASSESNQKSFETHKLQQGLLTFSLLRGLSGKASTNDMIYVVDLLSFAAKDSEELGQRILGKTQHPVFDIGENANSFPIGIKSEDLEEIIPESKIKVCKPNFADPVLFHDPFDLEDKLIAQLQERGAFGSQENFVFTNNKKDAYTINGSYTINQNQIIIKWHILKNDALFKGPFETSKSTTNEEELMNFLINQMLIKIQ